MDFLSTDFWLLLKWPCLIGQLILSPLLILLVLLQPGKGDDIGSAFSGGGGGSSSILGTGGASKFLVRGTVVIVTLFMLNSIALAKIFKKSSEASVTTTVTEPLAPKQNGNNAAIPAANAIAGQATNSLDGSAPKTSGKATKADVGSAAAPATSSPGSAPAKAPTPMQPAKKK
jgi:preprotein translocase subunit SecG